ncbi:hypothetical protein SIN8267_00046 [Sinobacterium norvegicum]|uniref:SPOR domain-containing protein n=1 Tax=Sinobacterium norvegicum TaxID=1641715 RepID=A0ABM9AAE1_9GAMM|nr:hypothetical protein [Sinobacterium norvegicum]CAH0989969.1 hypothetical protein SIN8267_00046 [Sinobacterium norvegicum]
MIARVIFTATFLTATLLSTGCSNSARISEDSPKDWICKAAANGEWDCQWRYSDSGEPYTPSNKAAVQSQANPVEQSKTSPAAAANSSTAPANATTASTTVTSTSVATAAVAAAKSQTPSPLTREKLEASPRDYYVVQLASFTQPSSVTKYTTFYQQLTPLSITSPSGKILLLENVYPDYNSASQAVSQYPSSDKIEQPWIRSVSEVTALLNATK